MKLEFTCHLLKKQGCSEMNRYNIIHDKNPREIVLLRSHKCKWGRCFFCDYIHDNMTNEAEMVEINRAVLKNVENIYDKLEVINSASVFELPKTTLSDIKNLCKEKGIKHLIFEAYYNYRHRLNEIREYFDKIDVSFKCGIETFDNEFRNNYLRKNVYFNSPEEVAYYFKNICLMVGIKGQTPEMIDTDMAIALKYFDRICINIFTENSTPVKRDEDIIHYFKENYQHLEENNAIEILWNNTDFGVGDTIVQLETKGI